MSSIKRIERVLMDKKRRNRNRSRRRPICCPSHGCYMDSVSQKYPLYADKAEHLRQRGFSRKISLTLTANCSSVPLQGEWLEAFWCEECQETIWFHVRRMDQRLYEISPAPVTLWRQVSGVIHPSGNPSVGEFTRIQARATRFNGIKDFQRIG